MRYDYSLDVGQSMESEEELKARQEKEQQEKQQAQEKAPSSGEELSAKRMEAEIKQEAEKEAEKAGASEVLPEENAPEEKSEESTQQFPEEQPAGSAGESPKEAEKEDISVKEISFEKAELIEEHQKAQKTIEEWEQKGEPDDAAEDESSEEMPKDELEEDVNDIIEDSFKEPQNYMNNSANNHSGPKEYEEPKKSYAIPIALGVIFLCAVIFGFVYFMYPENAASAATADIPGEGADLEPVVPEKAVAAENAAKPNVTTAAAKPAIANITKTVLKDNVTKQSAVNLAKKSIEEPKKEAGMSDEQALSDILLSGLN